MPETDHSFSQVESPASGTRVPQGWQLVRGWVWPRPGGHFVDVRARVSDRFFPGIHGFPRPDLAAHFQTGRPVALAEFSVAVELAPGPREIVLEALAIEGRWLPFQTVSLEVVPANPPAVVTLPVAPLRWIDHGHGLRRLLVEAARQPDETLDRLAASLAGELPWPRVIRDAPAPLIGFVDEPASMCGCRFGRIPAFGHLFHPIAAIRRILATVDLQSWQPLAQHQPSPGPAAFYAQQAHARDCGFIGLVDVPAQLPNPVSLRIYAELEDGSLHLGPVVRTRLHASEADRGVGMGRPGCDFELFLTAWEQALAARKLPVERGPELDRYLAELREEYVRFRRPRPRIEKSTSTPAKAQPVPPRRVLLATHGLSLQGAPRFLLELGRAHVAAGARLDVVSAEEGPLRKEFEALGAAITVLDCGPVLAATSPAEVNAALDRLSGQADWRSADLVIANSFTTFWAVHVARAYNRPVLFYVHESTTPAAFYDRRVSAAVVASVEGAFDAADGVAFTTAATRDCHLNHGRPERYHVVPAWVDLVALDRWRAGQDRRALRRELGVADDAQLVCNIGTISDRKGQHTFARAVDLLWRRHPGLAARTRFILLGGRDTAFDHMLGAVLAELGRENLVVHRETPDYLRYYLAADLFACSSYEESSPRVVFEAMACGTPIIASAVQGVPELVRPDLEALLLPPGDTAAWCDGLVRMLTAPAIGRELAARARARAENQFAADAVWPRHLKLARDVAGEVA